MAKIMIVEDDFLIAMTLQDTLSDAGHSVVEASDTDDALRSFETIPDIDLVITDIQLPGSMDGLQLGRRLRESRPDLPIIFTSGRSDPRGAAHGARDVFVGKPYLPSELCTTILKVLSA